MKKDSDLKSSLWQAADVLRGAVDSRRYADYLFALLFLRFVSDWHDRTLNEYRRKYQGDQVRIARAMHRERFIVPNDCTFEKLSAQRGANNLGAIINSTLHRIVDSNPKKLGDLFAGVDFNSAELGTTERRNARLIELLEIFSELGKDARSTSDVEWAATLATWLIGQFAEDSRQRTVPYTPREISILLTQILNPKPGDRIYDPACGTGGLLLEAARFVESNDFALFGHEPAAPTWELCKITLMLQGMDAARIIKGDPIRQPLLTADDTLEKFNVVLADVHFSLPDWGIETLEYDRLNRFKRGVPPRSTGDYAYITHVVETMSPLNGRAGVVVPLGALFRGGSEGLIRTRLLEEGRLAGVVRLPANLYLGTGMPVALMLFRAEKSDRSVFFIDASREFSSARNRSRLSDEDIEKILSTWKSRNPRPQYSYLASYSEIESKEFNLHVPLYVRGPAEDQIDRFEVAAEIEKLEQQQTLARQSLSSALDELFK